MKACPVCGRLYPADAAFCPEDGAELMAASQAPVLNDGGDARIGTLLSGRYQLRRVVADGGMGRVYEALDLQAKRNVAVKILHPDVAQDPVAVERFKREFEVSRQLPHDHIVEVLDFRPTTDGSYMLVMEFLYGDELRGLLDRERTMNPARLVRLLSQIAIALDRAHQMRFVHRDLKPDNLFLVAEPRGDHVKILDFGSVKDKTDSAKKLTVMGTTIGSPFYMAPEQAQGLDTLDHRADVWALAAIAYEALSGEVPFKGVNGPSILLEILTKEPRPITRVAAGKQPVPPQLDLVMAHAFKKSAALRTPSVGALADEIGHAYGLVGDHRAWAQSVLAELTAELAAALPAAMARVAVQAGSGDSAADSFFGDGLLGAEEMADPFGAAPQRPKDSARARSAAQSELAKTTESRTRLPSSDDGPLVVPKGGVPIVPIVIGVVLVLGLLTVVAVVMLLRS